MTLAVPRCMRTGRSEAGVVYVDVTTFGAEARECVQLPEGSVVGLSGRLYSDPPEQGIGVLIDQLDLV
jgi:single-stranded DNA-binding protein